MKRYIWIVLGIIAAAIIIIIVLLFIKGNLVNTGGGNGTLNASGTTSGSLPSAGTQGTGGGNGAAGGSTSTNSNGSENGSGGAPGSGSGVTNVGSLGLTPIASGSAPSVAPNGGQMNVQNFGVLSSAPVIDYFIDPQNKITALQTDGEVITVSNGQTATLNSSTISDIISASFSYDGKMILVNYGDPADPQSGIFSVSLNTWTALPQGMMSPQWSPSGGYQIAYLATTASGNLALAIMNAAKLKSSPTIVVSLPATDLTLQWPLKNEFILSDKPTSQAANSIWTYDAVAGTLNSLLYEVSGAESSWSHNAAFPYGLVFSGGNGGSSLQLESLLGTTAPKTFTFMTLPSKCGFDAESMATASSTGTSTTTVKGAPTSTAYLALYCGIPRSTSGFSSANLPDDYNTTALYTSDDIYKINSATGDMQSLWSDPTQNMDVSDVKFANNALFFVNRYDSKLYGLTFSNG